MQPTERVMIWNAAAAAATVVLAYVLGLRDSSVMSLTTRAQNITHTATNQDVTKTNARHYGTRCRSRTRGYGLLTYYRTLTALQYDFQMKQMLWGSLKMCATFDLVSQH
jgi:hypothetical protein